MTTAIATGVMPGDRGERRGAPEQQRERVGELAGELSGPAPAAAALELVRAGG